jgi:hypothetical protein
MPGLDIPSSTPAETVTSVEVAAEAPIETKVTEATGSSYVNGKYYNARLDPKNFLEGELSWNPSTRLRQMLARPGIVVSFSHEMHLNIMSHWFIGCPRYLRWHQRTLLY